MIRISQIREGSQPKLIVEGVLSDDLVDALETTWLEVQSQLNGARLRVDVSGLTYVDDKGRDLLARIMQSGAEVRAAGIMNRTIVNEIAKEIEDARRDSRDSGQKHTKN